MTYKLTDNSDRVIRLADAAWISRAIFRDWNKYEQWLAAGNVPAPADPPAPPPTPQQLVDLIAAAKGGDNPTATALFLLIKGLAAGAILPGATTPAQIATYMVNNWPPP